MGQNQGGGGQGVTGGQPGGEGQFTDFMQRFPPGQNPMYRGGQFDQPNPWAAATSRGGVGGTSMYPNQNQFQKPMLAGGTGGAGFVGTGGQDPASPVQNPQLDQSMRQPPFGGMPTGGRVFAGGPGGFRSPMQPVQQQPQDIASLLAQFRR